MLADELASRPVKVLLVASAAATDEGLAFLQTRLAPLPVIGMDATLAAAELTERVCCGLELDPNE